MKTKSQLAEEQRIREVACQCSSVAITALPEDGGDVVPALWAMTFFFEQYILHGAHGTKKNWGPKEPEPKQPVSLRVVPLAPTRYPD